MLAREGRARGDRRLDCALFSKYERALDVRTCCGEDKGPGAWCCDAAARVDELDRRIGGRIRGPLSASLTISIARSLTSTAGSCCRFWRTSSKPELRSRPTQESEEAWQMSKTSLSKLTRTSGFFVESFCFVRTKISSRARQAAIGGLMRAIFCKGSRRLSNTSLDVSLFRKQPTIASLNDPCRSRCSTRAVSSDSLSIC